MIAGRGHGYPPLMKFLFLYSDKKGFPLVGSEARDAVVNDCEHIKLPVSFNP